MFGKKKQKSEIIKLGSETETPEGVYHLCKDGDNGGYSVWLQPYETWNGKKFRSYKNWRKCNQGSLGECRKTIKSAKQASAEKPKNKK